MRPGQHAVLFYDDDAYARTIEFLYILKGLEDGESCIYTTHGEPQSVEAEMLRRGIDVGAFKSRGLLRVCTIRDPLLDPRGVEHGVAQILGMLFEEGQDPPPSRIVSRFVRKTATEPEISANMQIDCSVQAAMKHRRCLSAYTPFESYAGSLICPYPLRALGPEHREWVISHLRSHDAAIFAPRDGAGLVLTS